METSYDLEGYSPEILRELGKKYFFNTEGDKEKKDLGAKMLLSAYKKKDPEATFIVATLIMDGVFNVRDSDPTEYALSLMCNAANKGCIQARAFINTYCENRYSAEFEGSFETDGDSPLVDFDGRPIRVNRKGIFTPVDAVLENRDGENVLVLSTNICFKNTDGILSNAEDFKKAVLEGIKEWEGNFEVFGGQSLKVELNVTAEDRLIDSVIVIPLEGDLLEGFKYAAENMRNPDKKERIENIIEYKRSFASGSIWWTVNSLKLIFVQSESGKFDDYEEIKHVVKHEFGHALGLGDLYSSDVDSLDGVEIGTYKELDCYAVTDKYYNLVMCDHHGPISNNDIEMVILAFRENKMQHFQECKLKGKISDALGKGN